MMTGQPDNRDIGIVVSFIIQCPLRDWFIPDIIQIPNFGYAGLRNDSASESELDLSSNFFNSCAASLD